MLTLASKLSIRRSSITIRPVAFRYMHSTFSNSNSTYTTNLSQEMRPPSFSPKIKGVCVAITSLNSPVQVVKHSSLYTDKGYRYLCFKLADSPSANNHKLNSHILSVLEQPEEELGLLFHIMLPQPNQYLSTLLSNWASSDLYQSNKLPLKGVIIDKIQPHHNTHEENVTVCISTISIPVDTALAPNQGNELLLLDLSNPSLVREKAKETAPTKLSYKSVLHNFLDFIDSS